MKVISLLIGVACLLIFPIYGDADADSKPAVIEESEEVDSEVVATDLQLQVQESRPWESPNYGGQKSALGYDDQAFVTPLGLEDRVHFWTRIYTEFTTDQGVIHDQKYQPLQPPLL